MVYPVTLGWPFPWHKKTDSSDTEPVSVFDPVLLIPGIGGSILNAVSNDGKKKERIWVRLLRADHEFCRKLWSKYNPETGKTESLDPASHIEVPQDNFGLYACDSLDPDLRIPLDMVYYYHKMIVEMRNWGYVDGVNLFGYGYDFRQSNRLPETMDAIAEKLRSIHELTGKKVNVITHSMGGLVFKSFVSLRQEEVASHVQSWIAIAAPFRGAPGFIMDTLLTGVEFLKGWQKELFVAKWSMHQLLVECPSVYELMAEYEFEWKEKPELRIVHSAEDGGKGGAGGSTRGGAAVEQGEKSEGEGGNSDFGVRERVDSGTPEEDMIGGLEQAVEGKRGDGVKETGKVVTEGVGGSLEGEAIQVERINTPQEIIEVLDLALANNSVTLSGSTIALPLCMDIVEWAAETRNIWNRAKLPDSVKFYNIYGVGLDTPFHTCYGSEQSPIVRLEDILHTEAEFENVDGDGTVPAESAEGDGFDALLRVGVPGEHRALLGDGRVLRLVKYFLNVGEFDPLYDPLTDCVLVPTREQIEAEAEESELEELVARCSLATALDVANSDEVRGGGAGLADMSQLAITTAIMETLEAAVVENCDSSATSVVTSVDKGTRSHTADWLAPDAQVGNCAEAADLMKAEVEKSGSQRACPRAVAQMRMLGLPPCEREEVVEGASYVFRENAALEIAIQELLASELADELSCKRSEAAGRTA